MMTNKQKYDYIISEIDKTSGMITRNLEYLGKLYLELEEVINKQQEEKLNESVTKNES